MRSIFMLLHDTEPFIFVIPPSDFKITSSQNSEVAKILDVGEVALIGEKNIKKVKFSTFLPAKKSKFFNLLLNPHSPMSGIKKLEKYKDNKEVLTLTSANYSIYFKCYIEQLEYEIVERTGDIDITIDLIEVSKQTRLIDDVNNLYERYTGKTSPIKEYQLEERFEDLKSGLKNKIKEKINNLIKV